MCACFAFGRFFFGMNSLMLDSPNGAMYKFYNDPAVQEALNVHPKRQWLECMPGAGRRRLEEEDTEEDESNLLPGQILLAHDRPISVVPYVAELLDEAGINVLIYNGDRDMTTNSVGSERLLDAMAWQGAEGWADSKQYERGMYLPFPETLGGYIKTYRNLQFLIVTGSGHLVPMNEPKIALDLITRFLGGKSFLDKALPAFDVKPRQTVPDGDEVMYQNRAEEVDVASKAQFPIKAFWMTVCLALVLGTGFGFLLARRFPSSRQGYEMVPSHQNGHH
jgi:Serine carboxypeptidase